MFSKISIYVVLLIIVFYTDCTGQKSCTTYLSNDKKALYNFHGSKLHWYLASTDTVKIVYVKNNYIYWINFERNDCPDKFYFNSTDFVCKEDSVRFNDFIKSQGFLCAKEIDAKEHFQYNFTLIGKEPTYDKITKEVFPGEVCKLDILYKGKIISSTEFITSDFSQLSSQNNIKNFRAFSLDNIIFLEGGIIHTRGRKDDYHYDSKYIIGIFTEK